MVAGKESIIHFEKKAKQQETIYYDAADYGYIISNNDDLKTFREHIQILRSIYQSEVEFWGDYKQRVRSWGSRTKIKITVEKDWGCYRGYYLEVIYNYDPNPQTALKPRNSPLQFIAIEQHSPWLEQCHSFLK
jgi:hypothetical protein